MEDEVSSNDHRALGRLVNRTELVEHIECLTRPRQFSTSMKIISPVLLLVLAAGSMFSFSSANAQVPATQPQAKSEDRPVPAANASYSGMYSFLKDGEFLQITVEDGGTVTGYVSRFAEGESDKGAFLDQFFKNGRLEGNKLAFTTEIVHGASFDFHGVVERGEGKNPGDEAYYILKGTLTQNVRDADKKVRSQSREVVFRLFPQDAGPAVSDRK